LQEAETLLQELASDEEEGLAAYYEYEPEILQAAIKYFRANRKAWLANLRSGKGNEETNRQGAERFLKKIQAAEAKLKTLETASA